MKINLSFIIILSFSFFAKSVIAESQKDQSQHVKKQSVFTVGIEECIEFALRYNEEIKAANYDIDIIKSKKIEATKRYIPVFKYRHRVGPVPRDIDNAVETFFKGDISVLNSSKAELGLPLYTFGRISTARVLADIGIDAAQLQMQKKSDEVVLTIYKLYNGILLARELKALAHQALQELNKKIKELDSQDVPDQLGALKLKVALFEVEKRLDEAVSKEGVALSALKVQMGLEDDVVLHFKKKSLVTESFPLKSFEHYLELSQKSLVEYELLQKGLLAKATKVELEKREYYPNIILGGFAEYGLAPGIRETSSDTNDFTDPFNFKRAGIGFEMTGDLDFRKIKSKVTEAKVDYLKTIALKRAAHHGLELELKKIYLEFKRHRNLVARADKEKRTARQIVLLTKSNLDLGVGDNKDFQDALQSYLLFQARYYESVFYYNVSVAELKQKTGQMYGFKNYHPSALEGDKFKGVYSYPENVNHLSPKTTPESSSTSSQPNTSQPEE